jgi:hypothetical protein
VVFVGVVISAISEQPVTNRTSGRDAAPHTRMSVNAAGQWEASGVDYRDEEGKRNRCDYSENYGDVPASHMGTDWLGWIYAYV